MDIILSGVIGLLVLVIAGTVNLIQPSYKQDPEFVIYLRQRMVIHARPLDLLLRKEVVEMLYVPKNPHGQIGDLGKVVAPLAKKWVKGPKKGEDSAHPVQTQTNLVRQTNHLDLQFRKGIVCQIFLAKIWNLKPGQNGVNVIKLVDHLMENHMESN